MDDGIISGTPTETGTYPFRVHAVSTAGTLAADQYWNVTVSPPLGWAPSFIHEPQTTYIMGGTVTDGYSAFDTTILMAAYSVNAESTRRCSITLWRITPAGYPGTPRTDIQGKTADQGPGTVRIKAESLEGGQSAYLDYNFTGSKWAPTFTTTPSTTAIYGEGYVYNPELNETGICFVDPSTPVGLNGHRAYPLFWHYDGSDDMLGGNLDGDLLPGIYNCSVYGFSSPGGLIAYQNWTLTVTLGDGSIPDIDGYVPQQPRGEWYQARMVLLAARGMYRMHVRPELERRVPARQSQHRRDLRPPPGGRGVPHRDNRHIYGIWHDLGPEL